MITAKRTIAILAVFTLLLTLVPIQAEAADDQYQFIQVPVYNGHETKSYDAISYEGDLYFSAEDYGLLSRYSFKMGDQKFAYTLGDKMIIIDPAEEKMSISALNYEGETSAILEHNGKYYVSASFLLPWLNVVCNQVGYGLEIIPDGISLWEITNKLQDYNGYFFNLSEDMGDSVADVAGLCAMSIFDTLINTRWDRLIPADGTLTGAMRGASLYDLECYISALSELGAYEFDFPEDLETNIENIVNVNSGLNSYEELLGIAQSDEIESLKAALREKGADENDLDLFLEQSEEWNVLREGFTSYEKVSKYLNVFSILKNVELTAQTTDEYRDFLVWLSANEEDNQLLKSAATAATSYLDKNSGVFVSMLMNYTKKVLDGIPSSVFEAIDRGVVDPSAIADCASVPGTFFGSADLYMGISKLFYSYVIPVAGGFEGMAKAGIVENIQDTCLSHTKALKAEELTVGNIMLIRQNYLAALQAAKMNYKSSRDMMDVKIFGLIPVFQSEGLLDDQIQKIEKVIIELIASADYSMNDSIEGKEEYRDRLQTLFSQLLEKIPTEDLPISLLFGTWNFYTGGTWSSDFSDLYGYHGYQLKIDMDGSINVLHYIMNSGVGESYDGTWEVINDTENGTTFRLNVSGGSPVLGEEFVPESFSGDVKFALEDDKLIITLVSGELYGIAFDEGYRHEYEAEEWIELQKEKLGDLLDETEIISSLPEEITSFDVYSAISTGPVDFSVEQLTINNRTTTNQTDEVKCTVKLTGNHLEITETLLLTYSNTDDGWKLDSYEKIGDEEIRVIEATDEMYGLALNDIGMDNGDGSLAVVFAAETDYSSRVEGRSAVFTYYAYYETDTMIQGGTISVFYTIHGSIEDGLWWQGDCDLSQLSTTWIEPDPVSTVWGDYRLKQIISDGETQSADDINRKGMLSFNSDGSGELTLSESYYNGGYMKQTTDFTWTQSGDMITLTYTSGQAYIGSTDYCYIDGNTITFDNYLSSVFGYWFERTDTLVFQK